MAKTGAKQKQYSRARIRQKAAEFERTCVRAINTFPNLTGEKISRAWENSDDITIKEYPNLKIDCKLTITGVFGFSDIRKFLQETKEKYCTEPDHTPVVMFAEYRDKGRIDKRIIGIAIPNKNWEITITPLLAFLDYLDKRSKKHG